MDERSSTHEPDHDEKMHPAARQRVNSSSSATKPLAELFAELNVLLRSRADRLQVQFRESAPQFYNGYRSARTVATPATGASAVEKSASATLPTATTVPKAA